MIILNIGPSEEYGTISEWKRFNAFCLKHSAMSTFDLKPNIFGI